MIDWKGVGDGILEAYNWAAPRIWKGTVKSASLVKDGIVYVAPHVQKTVNFIGPPILANTAALTAINVGVEGLDNLHDIPSSLELVIDAIGLAAFNTGVFVPIYRNGIANYARVVANKPTKSVPSPIGKNVKTALLAYVTVCGLYINPIKEGVYDSLERVVDNISGREIVLIAGPDDDLVQEPRVDWDDDNSNLVQSGNLEKDVQAYINWLRKKGFARKRGVENFAFYVKDLHSNEVVLDINSSRQQMDASVNKLYVLLAAMDQVQNKKLKYDSALKSDLELMISVSDNDATNRVINRIGVEEVNRIVQKYGFDDTIVEKIPKNGRTLKNKSTAKDLAEYFELLQQDQLPRNPEIRRILKLKSDHLDRIVDRTCIPTEINDLTRTHGRVKFVEDKTGYIIGVNTNTGLVTAQFETDIGVVDVPYVIVMMIEDKDAKKDKFRNGVWGPAKSETLRTISEMVYWHIFNGYVSQDFDCKEHNGVHPK